MNEILQKRIDEAAEKIVCSTQCAYFDLDKSCNCYEKKFCMETAEEILQNQWISVDEALPEEFDDGSEFVFVIVKIDDETSYYDTDYISNGKWELHDSDEVTHWMEIPKNEKQ